MTGGHVARMVLIGFGWETLRERTLRKPRRRWAGVQMELQNIGWEVAHDRDRLRAFVNTVMNSQVS